MNVKKSQKLPFKTSDYEDQTKTKHKVFKDYIDRWIKIVGKYNRLNYIDGFGGIGAYIDSRGKIHYGSPILAAKAIDENTSKLRRTVNLLVIDEDNNNLENIRKIFEHEKIAIKPTLIHGDFDKTINDILDNVKNLAPTFLFVDPFGFKIKMQTIERVMKIDKTEILLNFMFTRVNQFLSDPKKTNIYNDLFGNIYWQNCTKLHGEEREKCIIEGYRKWLKQFTRHVYYFRLEYPDKRRTYYYLFHLTNHFLGCSIIKSSFAKFNYGRVEYRGRRGSQLELFNNKDIIIKNVTNYLREVYKGQQKSFQEIIEEQIDETEFLESHMREAVKKMESNEVIINRIPPTTTLGKKRVGLEYKDIIIFR
ncbi:MAG: three-Cys-motif partner protein TcmP [Candidatus Scalinduaceae bacterium]